VAKTGRFYDVAVTLWFRKKTIQRFTCSGSAGRRGMYRDTVISETRKQREA